MHISLPNLENGKILEIDLSNFQNKYFANKVRPLMRILKSMKVQKLSFHLTNLPTNIEELRSDKALIAVGRLLEISGNSAATSIINDRIKQNMKKIEIVYRELLYQYLEKNNNKFTQLGLSKKLNISIGFER